ESAQTGHGAGWKFHGGFGIGKREFFEDGNVGCEWVASDVEAEEFFFVSEEFVLGPLFEFGKFFFFGGGGDGAFVEHAEEVGLAARAVLGVAGGAREGAFDGGEKRGAGFAKAI